MGNDGGTIVRGKDLRAVFGTHEQDVSEPPLESTELDCALTSLPLSRNGKSEYIVGDYKGRLYLKEHLLHSLLEKKLPQTGFLHIRTLDDIKDVKILFDTDDRIVCPLRGIRRSKHQVFCYLRSCGCVFAVKILQELRTHFNIDSSTDTAAEIECPSCSLPFIFNYDIVIINPDNNPEDSEFNDRNYRFLQNTLLLTHTKKERKRKRSETKEKRKKSKRLKDSQRSKQGPKSDNLNHSLNKPQV